jgi:hypothetical protein
VVFPRRGLGDVDARTKSVGYKHLDPVPILGKQVLAQFVVVDGQMYEDTPCRMGAQQNLPNKQTIYSQVGSLVAQVRY